MAGEGLDAYGAETAQNGAVARSRRLLAALLAFVDYPSPAAASHLQHFDTLVSRFMGPAPPKESDPDPGYKCIITHDHQPIEMSVCWAGKDAAPRVRYCVEPVTIIDPEELRADPVRCNTEAARALMEAEGWGNPGPRLARLLMQKLVWHGSKKEMAQLQADVPVKTQVIVGWDLAPDGTRVGKEYVMPLVLAGEKGVSPTELLSSVAPSLGAVLSPMSRLPAWLQPKLVVVGCDVLESAARIKAYFRLTSAHLPHVLEMMRLGAKAPLSQAQVGTIVELWECVTGASPVDAPPPPTTWPSGYPLLYYDMAAPEAGDSDSASASAHSASAGPVVKSCKLYISVRYSGASDDAAASGLQEFLRRRGYQGWEGYWDALAPLAVNGRALSARAGMHTYISCHFKDSRAVHPEITAYIQPDPERLVARAFNTHFYSVQRF